MNRRLFVFDTNALLSAFLVKNSVSDQAFKKAILGGTLAISDSLMNEFAEVLWRPKFDKYFAPEERAETIREIEKYTIPFLTMDRITESKDPKDNRILELASAARASCIVTGDKKHLLSLHPFRGIPILSPADFLKQF